MKTFKRIYYPALALLILLSLILTITLHNTGGSGGAVSGSNSFRHAETIAAFGPRGQAAHESSARENTRNYITAALEAGGFTRQPFERDQEDALEFAVNADNNPIPTFAVVEEWVSGYFGGIVAAGMPVENIIAVIPGRVTSANNNTLGQAVVLLAEYDTGFITGGAGNASTTGALLETALTLVNNPSRYDFEHDIVIAFTTNGIWGQVAVTQATDALNNPLDRIDIFGNISSRVSFAVEFDARSNRGSLGLYEATLNAAAAFVHADGSINATSMVDLSTPNVAFDGVPALRFAALGGARFEGGRLDTTPSRRIANQTAASAYSLVRYLGNANLDRFASDRTSATYTYLNIPFTYNNIVGFVLVGLVIALAGLVVVFNLLKLKAAGDGKLGSTIAKIIIAFFTQVIAFGIATLTLYVAYALIGVVAMGFEVLLPQAFWQFTFGNPGFIIGIMMLSSAALIWAYILFKRIFHISSADLARGNLALWVIAAILTAIFFTPFSYLFVIMAVLQLTVSLIRTFTKDVFKAKTGMPMDRLLLPLIPMLITLPILLPILLMSAAYIQTLFLPLIFVLFFAWAGFALPYFSLCKPIMDKAFEKLPQYPVRYERTVTERVEDKAKKGKFKEVTGKKIIVEKRNFTYKHRISIIAITVVSVFVIIFSSFFAGQHGSQAVSLGNSNMLPAVHNEALIYDWNGGRERWVIADINAFRRYRNRINDFRWDDTDEVFYRALTGDESAQLAISDRAPTIVLSEHDLIEDEDARVFRVESSFPNNAIRHLTLSNASEISLITLVIPIIEEPVEIRVMTGLDDIHIDLPFNIGWFYITVDEPTGVRMHYSEYIIGTGELSPLAHMEPFDQINSRLADRNRPLLRGNLIFRTSHSM